MATSREKNLSPVVRHVLGGDKKDKETRREAVVRDGRETQVSESRAVISDKARCRRQQKEAKFTN
jgi:hypothetical protein